MRATEMIRELEYLCSEDRLRELGLSAWRREGCEETSLQPSSTYLKGAYKWKRTEFLHGMIVIGQGEMALN